MYSVGDLAMTPIDDERLVADLMSRRPSAMELIYDRFAVAMYTLALMTVGNTTTAEQIVEDALLALWRNPQGARVECQSLRTYLYEAVRRLARDRLTTSKGTRDLEPRVAAFDRGSRAHS